MTSLFRKRMSTALRWRAGRSMVFAARSKARLRGGARIAEGKVQIAQSEWDRCIELGRDHLQSGGRAVRSGSPFTSFEPGILLSA